MNNSKGVWYPKSPMTGTQKAVLSVEANRDQQMSFSLLLTLLELKIKKLIQDTPEAERILKNMLDWPLNLKESPSAIVNNDGMQNLLKLIDWEREKKPRGLGQKPEPLSLQLRSQDYSQS